MCIYIKCLCTHIYIILIYAYAQIPVNSGPDNHFTDTPGRTHHFPKINKVSSRGLLTTPGVEFVIAMGVIHPPT